MRFGIEVKIASLGHVCSRKEKSDFLNRCAFEPYSMTWSDETTSHFVFQILGTLRYSCHRSCGPSLCSIASKEPSFHPLNRQQVCNQHGSQDQEKGNRRRHKTEMHADRAERQKNSRCQNSHRASDQPWVRTALERVFTRADNKDDQHLRGHGFNEPAGMKEHLPCMKKLQQDIFGGSFNDNQSARAIVKEYRHTSELEIEG